MAAPQTSASWIDALAKEWAEAKTEDARRNLLDSRAPFPETLPREITNAGEALQRKSLYDEALNYYHLTTAIAEKQGNDLYAAIGLQLVGSVLRLRGEYAESLATYARARAFAEKSGNRARVSMILANTGAVYMSQSRFTEGRKLIQESLTVMPPDVPPTANAPAYQNLAISYALQGDYRRALQSFSTVLSLYEKTGNRTKIALTHQNLGVLHSKQGNYEAAHAHLAESLKIAEELGDPTQIAQTTNELGLLYAQERNFPDAIRALDRGREIADRLQLKLLMGDVRNSIADVYSLQRRYNDALPALEEAARIFEVLEDAHNLARTLRGTSDALAHAGKQQRALDAAEHATDLSRKIGDVEGEWKGRALQANALRGLNRVAAAREQLKQAVDLIESQRWRVAGGDEERERYFEHATYPYHALIDLCVAASQPMDALRFAERAKARTLLDVLAHGPERVDRDMTDQERAEERELLDTLSAADAQLLRASVSERAKLEANRDRLRQKQAMFVSTLYARHPELRVARGAAPALEPAELEALLPSASDALIQYVVAEDRAWMFVITRGDRGARVDVFPILVGREELSRSAGDLRNAIARRDPGFRRQARSLYDLLIRPAMSPLSGKSRVWLVPDGPLWDLPFQTLTSSAGRYWVEDVTISLAPSFAALRDLSQRRLPSTLRLVAMGDPVRPGVARVPETSRQVQQIASVYGSRDAATYVGKEATEARFRREAGQAGILHLATHGLLDEQNPLYSRLIFSESGTAATADDDGYVEAWELMRMKLNAHLAVLSACETGRGQVAQGEGMIGLNWALFVAGVPSSVVSQWKVEAASSTALLVNFYRAMKTGSSPAASLRKAALAVKADKRYEHPFYWAPFILVGRDR